ncbi:uncharacterized protein LOC110924286 [Helianthus annuus]|uniref:uncharacterized protein LOC110924286 n=1 Tax=Helianthus annuus TaxID=4232 RepID=UPI000B8F64ED|nr:uncharacterized protein LOC110924286 [Helianthus annuus]
MEKLLARYGVTHCLSTAYHPQTSGQVENVNRELEHRALWALKTVNLDMTEAARKRFFQIHELEKLRDTTYARSLGIKEKTKLLHDRRLRQVKEFSKGDKVLLYNSRLKLFAETCQVKANRLTQGKGKSNIVETIGKFTLELRG